MGGDVLRVPANQRILSQHPSCWAGTSGRSEIPDPLVRNQTALAISFITGQISCKKSHHHFRYQEYVWVGNWVATFHARWRSMGEVEEGVMAVGGSDGSAMDCVCD